MNLALLEMRHCPKDKENCLKNRKRNTQNGFKGHLSLDLNLKTHCVLNEKLDSLKQIKITANLGSQLTPAGSHFKIQFNKRSTKKLLAALSSLVSILLQAIGNSRS